MNTIKNTNLELLVIILMTLLGACVPPANISSSTPSTSSAASPAPSAPVAQVQSIDTSIVLSIYSLSKTIAPVNGWVTKTVTLTAYCTEYESQTYCWDDGIQTIPSWTYNHFTYTNMNYTFWGLNGTSSSFSTCSGGCSQDFLQNPTLINPQLRSEITIAETNDVLDNGTMTQVTCTEDNNTLNCGSFTLNLNQ